MASHWANPQENQFITHHLREPPICNVVLLETFTNTYSNSLNFMGKLMLTIAAADSLPDWLLLLDPNDASCLHTNFVGPVCIVECSSLLLSRWHDNCPHQLRKKMTKETLFNIWRNEKYFLGLCVWSRRLSKINITLFQKYLHIGFNLC